MLAAPRDNLLIKPGALLLAPLESAEFDPLTVEAGTAITDSGRSNGAGEARMLLVAWFGPRDPLPGAITGATAGLDASEELLRATCWVVIDPAGPAVEVEAGAAEEAGAGDLLVSTGGVIAVTTWWR